MMMMMLLLLLLLLLLLMMMMLLLLMIMMMMRRRMRECRLGLLHTLRVHPGREGRLIRRSHQLGAGTPWRHAICFVRRLGRVWHGGEESPWQ